MANLAERSILLGMTWRYLLMPFRVLSAIVPLLVARLAGVGVP